MHWAIVFQIIILFNLHNYLLFWSHFCKWGNSVLMKLSGMDTIWQSKEHTVWHCRARYFCGELYCTFFGLWPLFIRCYGNYSFSSVMKTKSSFRHCKKSPRGGEDLLNFENYWFNLPYFKPYAISHYYILPPVV